MSHRLHGFAQMKTVLKSVSAKIKRALRVISLYNLLKQEPESY